MADYRVIHAFLLLSTWDYMVLSHEDPTVEIEMSINPELKRNNADIRTWEILFASSNPPPSLLEEDIMVKGFAKLNSPPSSKYKIKIFRKQNSAEESKTETYNKNRVGSATLQVEVKGISIDFWINSNSLQFQLGCVQGSHETVVTQSPDSTSSNELQFVVSKTNGQQQFTMYCRKHITTTEFVSATTNLSSIMDTDETTSTLWNVTRPTESTGNYRDLGGNLPTTTLAASPSVDLTILTGTPSQRTSTSLPASIGTPSQIRNTSLPASIAIPIALLLVAGFVVGIVFWRMKNKRKSNDPTNNDHSIAAHTNPYYERTEGQATESGDVYYELTGDATPSPPTITSINKESVDYGGYEYQFNLRSTTKAIDSTNRDSTVSYQLAGSTHPVLSNRDSTVSYQLAGSTHPVLSNRDSTVSYQLAGSTHPVLSNRDSTVSYQLAGSTHSVTDPMAYYSVVAPQQPGKPEQAHQESFTISDHGEFKESDDSYTTTEQFRNREFEKDYDIRTSEAESNCVPLNSGNAPLNSASASLDSGNAPLDNENEYFVLDQTPEAQED